MVSVQFRKTLKKLSVPGNLGKLGSSSESIPAGLQFPLINGDMISNIIGDMIR